jgi:hypothetical protein
LGSAPPDEVTAAQAATRIAALRMADDEQCAAALVAKLDESTGAQQEYLLDLLGQVGGKTALTGVVARAHSDDPAAKDVATRVLGDWNNADAAETLLDIAQNDKDSKYKIRALRGYIRIARQFQMDDEIRLSMFQTAMKAAIRDEERQLSLDVLSRMPSTRTLEIAAEYFQPETMNEAAAAAVAIAQQLVDKEPALVANVMQQVVDANVKGRPGNLARQLLARAQAAGK